MVIFAFIFWFSSVHLFILRWIFLSIAFYSRHLYATCYISFAECNCKYWLRSNQRSEGSVFVSFFLCKMNARYPMLSLSNSFFFCLLYQQWHSSGSCGSHHILTNFVLLLCHYPYCAIWQETTLYKYCSHKFI